MTGKGSFDRIRVIDKCLQNNFARYNRETLLEKVIDALDLEGLTLATIDKDLKYLKDELYAPLEYNRRDKFYYYAKEFSLHNIILSDEDERALSLSLSNINILKGSRYGSSYKALVERIVVTAKTSLNPGIVEFETGHSDPGLKWFDELFEYISLQKSIYITHTVYNGKPKEHLVSPYMIKEYRNRFYLVCRKHREDLQEPIYCFGMDRIEEIRPSKAPFKTTKGFKSSEFFKDSLGITRKMFEDPLKLKLRITSKSSPYVLSKPLHHSQKVLKNTASFVEIELFVYDSPELIMLLLSYGDSVKVLKPTSYAAKLKEEIKRMAAIYQ